MVDKSGNLRTGRMLAVGLAILALVAIVAFFPKKVNATESCVTLWQGNESGVAHTGYNFRVPTQTGFNCYPVTIFSMELVEGDPANSDSKADYPDWAIKYRTNDGIDAWAMMTLQFHIAPEAVSGLYPNYPDLESVKEDIVKPRLRSIVPQFLNNSTAEFQYLGNLTTISDEMGEQLRASLAEHGVVLDYFELKRSVFDESYEQAIRNRAKQVEATKLKNLEQQTATAEAERLRIATEGEQAAREQVVDTDAYITRTRADADKYALDQRAAALASSPNLLQWENIQAIRDAGAVYLPAGTLPIVTVPQAKE